MRPPDKDQDRDAKLAVPRRLVPPWAAASTAATAAMVVRTFVLAAVIPGVLGLLGSQVASAEPEERGEVVYERDDVTVSPAHPITTVAVDNRLGNLRIEGHDGREMMIIAVKRAADEGTLSRLKVTLIPDPAGPMQVSTVITPGDETRPIPSGSVAIDLIIRAPRSAQVKAQVWNGRLEVVGMENGAELSVNSGDIDVKNVSGTVVTHATSGKQQFVDVFGAVDAQAIAGEMDLDIVRGRRLNASVHEGSIVGRKVIVREVTLRAIKGDIHLDGTALAGGRYRIATYRGNLEVILGQAGPLSVLAQAPRGNVSLPPAMQPLRSGGDSGGARGDDGELRGTVPAPEGVSTGAAAVVELRSRHGSIRFAVTQ